MEGYYYLKRKHLRLLVTFKNGSPNSPSIEPPILFGGYFLSLGNELRQELLSWPLINVPNRKHDSMIPISIEGLLFYMDILAQQEDCKYYYSAQRRGLHQMSVAVGRINNLLTIVNIIDHLLQGKPIDDITQSLQTRVLPISPTHIERVTGNIITVHKDHRAISKLNIRID